MDAEDPLEVPEGAAVMPDIPAELGIHPLLLATLHAVIFLEGSEDHVVHPDAAVEAMEHMILYMQRLEGRDLLRIREDMMALAAFAKQEGWDKSAVRFFKEFLESFNIGTEEANEED